MASTVAALKANDYKSEIKPIWCPGCGHFGVLNGVTNTFADLGVDYNNTVVVSGIGCSSRFPFFLNSYGVHTAHGRALPVATGVKLANPSLNVLVVSGDGDCFSIGGGHVPHVARKNIDITCIMMNNRIYGLTKGQLSPTSTFGHVTNTSPYGSPDEPINPLLYMLAYGASFVARGFSGNPKQVKSLITAAMNHVGFSFVEIISPCPTFNKIDTADSFRDMMIDIPESHDSTDRLKAIDLTIKENDGELYAGIYYQVERTPYTEQLQNIKKKAGGQDKSDFEAIIDTFKP
ncbi:MAG: 2-oxoacid:ferredoxin oxidoreductase subunit beta [Nitrospinota bacterium]|nr:2-oxoacid:ferredoxin oxidoreductase subunit beta [Nitrospinota bacterium]